MSFTAQDVVPVSEARARLTELAVGVVSGAEKLLTKLEKQRVKAQEKLHQTRAKLQDAAKAGKVKAYAITTAYNFVLRIFNLLIIIFSVFSAIVRFIPIVNLLALVFSLMFLIGVMI